MVIYKTQKIAVSIQFIVATSNGGAIGLKGDPQEVGLAGQTYDIDTLIPSNTNLGALRTEINTDNAHCRLRREVLYRGKRVEWEDEEG